MGTREPPSHPQVRDRGITVLAEPADGQVLIDIIFVHGFNGDAKKTWTDESSGFFWPWEFREILPQARVMTFGYDAKIERSASRNLMGIHDYAMGLLTRVRNERPHPATTRPIAFVCHSLGGLIVKEALISSSNDPNYMTVYSATRAVFFFGTPHRGAAALNTKRLGILMNLAQFVTSRIPKELVEALKVRADELFQINDQFRNISLLQDNLLSITCFYERVEIPGLGDLVVDKDSAALGYPGEEDIGLALDHRNIVRYARADDDDFDVVAKTIRIKLQPILDQSLNDEAERNIVRAFGGQFRPRPIRTIPYLKERRFQEATADPAFPLRKCTDFALSWPLSGGKYAETWLNLLLVLGSPEGIITSEYVSRLTINPDDLPNGVTNPCAVNLGCAALLAGVVGCDKYTMDDGIPCFSGDNERLEFAPGGPFTMVGRYTQKLEMPSYLLQSHTTTIAAAGLGEASSFYSVIECTPMMPYLLTLMHSSMLLKDLRENRCTCGQEVDLAQEERTGLKLPALAMLAADTPMRPRIFPSKSALIFESTEALSQRCDYWRNGDNLATEIFVQELDFPGGTVITVSESLFATMPFHGDRIERRLLGLRRTGQTPKFIPLGSSWLSSSDKYEGLLTGVPKSRPEWPIHVRPVDFVLIEGIIEACNNYLSNKSYVWPGGRDRKSLFHTAVSCQLQEVEWWLGVKKPIAACETSILVRTLMDPIFEFPEGERRLVRALLILRVILIAMLLGMGLDNSAFFMTELGSKIVLLR